MTLKDDVDDIARDVLDHIDTMYPAMWSGVAATARISLRNTIKSRVLAFFRNREPSPEEVEAVARAQYEERIRQQFKVEPGASYHPRLGMRTLAWNDLPADSKEQERITARAALEAQAVYIARSWRDEQKWQKQ